MPKKIGEGKVRIQGFKLIINKYAGNRRVKKKHWRNIITSVYNYEEMATCSIVC